MSRRDEIRTTASGTRYRATPRGTAWVVVAEPGGEVIFSDLLTGQVITPEANTLISDDDPDAMASATTTLAAPWQVGTEYAEHDLTTYEGAVYRVVQPHTSQADWVPSAVPALYVRMGAVGASGPQPWVQPTGAHDAYNTGDRVTFEGSVYESLIDANVWSPAAYPAGWRLIE